MCVSMSGMPMDICECKGCTWMMRQTRWRSRYIPIFLHGDATPITGIGKSWAKSAQIWNWGSLLAKGSTKQIVFWIWCVFKDLMTRSTTHRRFWKIFCWSLRSLQTGLWPATNWDGERWAAESVDAIRAGTPLIGDDPSTCFACQLWRVKGDLEDFHEDRPLCTIPAHLQTLYKFHGCTHIQTLCIHMWMDYTWTNCNVSYASTHAVCATPIQTLLT